MINSTRKEIAASVRSFSKSFGETIVLEDISFDVNEGESLVLLGASGSGKTTLLRIVAGLEMANAGQIILHGKDVTELPARMRGTGVIFQSYALFPKMSVEKNIGYGLLLLAVLNQGRLEQIGTPFDVSNKPATEHVATFLGAANLLLGVIRGRNFESENIFLELEDEMNFKDGQSVKLVFRPEDVFLRKPENLTQHYQKLTGGTVEEVNFIGAFERVVVRLDLSTRQPIIVTRPKAETSAFPLSAGQTVDVGLVRFRILPNSTLASERAARMVDTEVLGEK